MSDFFPTILPAGVRPFADLSKKFMGAFTATTGILPGVVLPATGATPVSTPLLSDDVAADMAADAAADVAADVAAAPTPSPCRRSAPWPSG